MRTGGRQVLLFSFCLWMLAPLSSATERIGLVLGGGGARGAAHVGVLKVLEANNIVVDVVVGTSMGAIVGALYASGYRAEAIENILHDIDWAVALRDLPSRELLSAQRKIDAALIPSSLEVGIGIDGLRTPQGLIQGQNLGMLLRGLLGHVSQLDHFDQLPIPFRAVAADIVTGDQVVLAAGDLVDAVRASMSVPGVFQPIRIDERLLVDGGVVNNVPIDVARAMGADRLIVVDVGAGLGDEAALGSPASITMQVISILMDFQTRRTLEALQPGDVLIRPDLGAIGSADFLRAADAVPLGEAAALAHRDPLQAFRATPQRLATFEARPQPRARDPRPIDRITVEDSLTRWTYLVEHRLRKLQGKPADLQRIERHIGELYGENHYERISYQLEDLDDELVLRVTPIDKNWGPHFLRLGLRLSDDFDGGSTYQLEGLARIASDLGPGAEWRVRVALGQLNELGGSWRRPFGKDARTYLQPFVSVRAIDQPLFVRDQRQELARLRWSRARTGVELGQDWNPMTRTFLRYERGQDRLSRRIGSGDLAREFEEDYGFTAVGVIHDSLDDATFPTRGMLLDARLESYRPWMGAEIASEVVRFDVTRAAAFDRYLALAGVRGVSARSDDLSLPALDFLGGLANLSGFGERERAGAQLFLARLLLMRRMGEVQELFALPTYLGISLETGNTWQRKRDFKWNDRINAGSVYLGVDTPLGPMFVGYGRSDEGNSAVYLNFGSLIRPRQEF